MAGRPAKDFKQCAMCGRFNVADGAKDGFTVHSDVGATSRHRISCPCGLMTRSFQTKQGLQMCWNSRPKKPYKVADVKVTHPSPRGMTPDTAHGKKPF